MAPETNNYHPPSDRLKFDSFTSVPEVSIAQATGFPEKYFQADEQAFGKVHVNFAIDHLQLRHSYSCCPPCWRAKLKCEILKCQQM